MPSENLMKHGCDGEVWVKGMSFHRTKPCMNNARVQRAGKWYCGIHDPEVTARRRAKNDEKRQARYNKPRREFGRIDALNDLADAVRGFLKMTTYKAGPAVPTFRAWLEVLRAKVKAIDGENSNSQPEGR